MSFSTVMDHAASTPTLPTEIITLCDSIAVPITIADPHQHDLPLIYVNAAFEKLTQWKSAEVLGQNCRFLQGPKSDRTIIDDLALSFHHARGDVCSLINYRRDGSEFLNLIVVQPVQISKTRQVLMGCQFEYHLGTDQHALDKNAAAIDLAMRQLYLGRPLRSKTLNAMETYALDTVLMRCNVVFTKVQNNLVAKAAKKMRAELLAATGSGPGNR